MDRTTETATAPDSDAASGATSGRFSDEYERHALPGLHIDFDHGPDIELHGLALPNDTEDARLNVDSDHIAASVRQRMRYPVGWGTELAACLSSLIYFLGIVGLLKAFDEKAQPAWPYGITLNCALAILSTADRDLW